MHNLNEPSGLGPLESSVMCTAKQAREGPVAYAKPVAGKPPDLAVARRGASARYARHVLAHYGITHVFLLSLRRKEDRRQLMRRQLDAIGLNYTFIDAVDGVKGAITCYAGRATKLGGGNAEMCEKVSFLITLRVAMARAAYPVLIAEDDVNFDVRWPARSPLPPPRQALP